jgi:CBS domain containing-hemolysin-like protein
MNSVIFLTLIVLILLAIINITETATYSVQHLKIKALAEKGDKRAQILLKIKNKMSYFIGTAAILINTVNIVGLTAVGAVASTSLDDFSYGIFSIILIICTMFLGEILPKNFGERFSTKTSLFMAIPVFLIMKILSPILWILESITKIIFPKDKDAFNTSEEEIKLMIQMGAQENSIEEGEKIIIENVFKLNDKTAEDIMTPRVNIKGLDGTLKLSEQLEDIYNSNHSRLPVYIENYDDIIGFVLLRDILESLAKGDIDKLPTDFIHKIPKVFETIPLDNLLLFLQRKKTHIALVEDPFKGTAGIVTLEDVLEELVGEILDETDQYQDMRVVTDE